VKLFIVQLLAGLMIAVIQPALPTSMKSTVPPAASRA
jgi:hypothetical protein